MVRMPSDHPSTTTDPLHRIESEHPFRSLFRILGMHRGRFALMSVAYVIKDSPSWAMPVLTAGIIDAVVQDEGVGPLAIFGGLAVLVLLQNYPVGIFYNDQSSRIYRQVGADL